jgi:hypothetical protein
MSTHSPTMSIQDLSGLARNVTLVVEDLIVAGESTTPIRDNLVEMIDDGVCSAFDGGNGVVIDLDEQANMVVDTLTDLSDFTSVELTDIKNNFDDQFQSIEADVNYILDEVQGYARISYYAIGIVSMSSLLYIGAYLAWFGPRILTLKTYFYFQSWVVLPLYFLTLIFTAVFTSAIGSALVVNAGMCMDFILFRKT